MLQLLEEILRKHCMHSLKNKRQSTLNLLKAWQISKILLQNSHLLSVFKKNVSFHLNHNTMQMQVVPEANTWIKSNQSLITLRSGKVIEKPIFEPCEKDDELISEGKEGVELEHCKEKTDSSSALPFPHVMTKQRKVNHNSEIFETFKQVRIKYLCWMLLNRYLLMLNFWKICALWRENWMWKRKPS